jgi:hypothetical protein
MSQFAALRFVCKNCGGTKVVGEQFYVLGENWVDITCVKCSHSKDITVEDLKSFLKKINQSNAQSKMQEARDVNN